MTEGKVCGFGTKRCRGIAILFIALRSWTNFQSFPFIFLTGRIDMLQGLLQGTISLFKRNSWITGDGIKFMFWGRTRKFKCSIHPVHVGPFLMGNVHLYYILTSVPQRQECLLNCKDHSFLLLIPAVYLKRRLIFPFLILLGVMVTACLACVDLLYVSLVNLI